MKYVIDKLKKLVIKMDTGNIGNNELTIKEHTLLFNDPDYFIKITTKEMITHLLGNNSQREEIVKFFVSFKKRIPLHSDEIKQFDKIINTYKIKEV